MRRMKNSILPALLCLWLSPMAFGAALQGFLRLDTINGGSTDANHPGWMEVLSGTTGISKTGVKAVSDGLVFQKFLDTASPSLALACAQTTSICSGTVDLANTSASLGVVLRLNLTNIVLTSVSTGGSDSEIPSESLSLQAQVFSWNYTQFNPASGLAQTNVNSIWDFVANTGSYGGSAPGFISTGIRKSTGMELHWNATANSRYRIYAVGNLSQAFMPIAQVTTSSNGPASYFVAPVAPAMFYVVEQLPASY